MARNLVYLGLLLALGSCRGARPPEDPPAPGLRLRAVGPDGTPAPYVLVTVMSEATATPVNALYDYRLDLEADGRGELPPLPPGRYSVRLHTIREFRSGEGFDTVYAAPIAVEEGGGAEFEGALREGGRMRVSLVDGTGRGVPARLLVKDESGRAVAATFWRENQGGWTTEFLRLSPPGFVSCVLPPGRYAVDAIRYRDVVASGEVQVTAGEVAPLELTAGSGRR